MSDKGGLLVAIKGWDIAPWLKRFSDLGQGRAVYDVNQPVDAACITYAAVWKPAPGMLAALPNLKVIFNLGAGVDALVLDKTLPDVPLCRIVNPDLTARMSEYVAMNALMHLRQVLFYRKAQQDKRWEMPDQPAASAVRVGIMGMGVLGQDAAAVLIRLGFQVAGWSRSEKTGLPCPMFHGAEGLAPFLARTDMLVVLLPLTVETRHILDRNLFERLARDGALGGPVLINAGRGGLQNEADLITCLTDGTLKAASLDVFETEPLPPRSPLWGLPNVILTPHVAADSTPGAIVQAVYDTIARFERGEALRDVVDRRLGY